MFDGQQNRRGNVAGYDFRNRPLRSPIGVGSGQGGVKKDVSEIKVDVSGIKAQLPHLATQSDLEEVRADVSAIKAQLPQMAATSDVSDTKASIIQWLVATTLAAASRACAIAKFVH